MEVNARATNISSSSVTYVGLGDRVVREAEAVVIVRAGGGSDGG